MEFRIADTFTDSLARLTGEEQKAVKTTAFDLQTSPGHPSLSFHKMDRAKDKRFWSVRVSSDIRIIVHKTESSMLICYVDHHDKAYEWAERRKLETHPTTGAAQLVEIRERVQEIVVPTYIEQARPEPAKASLFDGIAEATLLQYGVPAEWMDDIRNATEDSLLELTDHLPAEAAEALLELATGGTPKTAPIAAADAGPFDHPDAQRRFRIINNVEELERALAYPWEKWTVFLHPAQREWVQRDFNGACVRFGRHRQDHRRAAPCRASRAEASRCPSAAGHVFGCARECAAHPRATPDRQRAAARGASRSPCNERDRRAAV